MPALRFGALLSGANRERESRDANMLAGTRPGPTEISTQRAKSAGHTTIGFNVTNLTGRDPPYLARDPNHLHFDGANASVLGRQYSLRFEKRW